MFALHLSTFLSYSFTVWLAIGSGPAENQLKVLLKGYPVVFTGPLTGQFPFKVLQVYAYTHTYIHKYLNRTSTLMDPHPSKCIYINDECEYKFFMYYVMCKCLHRKVYEYFYDIYRWYV